MKACIVSIGNELLNGQTTDTNSSWLAGRLLELGIATVGGWTVPDEISSIVKALEAAAGQADIVLVTGGLGPGRQSRPIWGWNWNFTPIFWTN